MTKPIQLRYHSKTFEFLQETPIISSTNVRLLDAWEKKRRIRLPASIREWYSLEGAEMRGTLCMAAYTSDNSIRPILREQSRLEQHGAVNVSTMFSVDDIGFRDGNVPAIARLDGTDDPVIVQYVEGEHDHHPFRKPLRFSEFVFRSLWDWQFEMTLYYELRLRMKPILVAVGTDVGPIEMDFLFEHLEELFRERRNYGKQTMRNPIAPGKFMKLFPHRFAFRHRWGYVALHCQANPERRQTEGKWFLLGNSNQNLSELAKMLWACGDFSSTLSAANDTGQTVLERSADTSEKLHRNRELV